MISAVDSSTQGIDILENERIVDEETIEDIEEIGNDMPVQIWSIC
jgi:L-serine deaminase